MHFKVFLNYFKIWVDQCTESYNKYFKKWLHDTSIKMYSTHNEGKPVVAGRFIRTLKNKIDKQMTAVSKNVYFDVLNNIVDEYNNTYHRTIKMKPDVKSDSIEYLLKDMPQIGQKNFLLSAKLRIQFHELISLLTLMVKKSLAHFMKKSCRRQIKKNLG